MKTKNSIIFAEEICQKVRCAFVVVIVYMKTALEWIFSTIAPSSPSREKFAALNDPFYSMDSGPPSQQRMTENETTDRQQKQQQQQQEPDPLYAEPWEDREGKLCALVYSGLSNMTTHVRKSMLYSNDMIISSETNGKMVQSVYWMGINHLYSTVFKSCHDAPGSVLYGKPYYLSTMSGMRMIGIPGESVTMIIDALWENLILRGYKVYNEAGQEIKTLTETTTTAAAAAAEEAVAEERKAPVEYDTREPDTEAEKSKPRRRAVPVHETSKNK